jgi:hypothetical protein
MQVLNHENRVFIAQHPSLNPDGSTHATQVTPCVFMPGFNEIDDKVWGVLKAWPTFQSALTSGLIEPLSKPIDNLLGKDPLAATALIKQTVQTKFLEKWLRAETREQIKQDLRKQIEALDVKNSNRN